MKKRIAFVINPKSGSDRKTDRVALIKSMISETYDAVIFEWKQVGDRDEIFRKVLEGNFNIAVAVGGDGTVSQLASALSGTSIALGIVPFGSGNGLARHLGIPLDPRGAMKLLEHGVIRTIDKGIINGQDFFCTAGTGFDAHIGKMFAQSRQRGFFTYAKMTLSEFRKYKAENYIIELDGRKIETEAFLITAANAGQYGNNAWIAPEASVTDGILHLVILKPFKWFHVAGIIVKMFRKKTGQSRFTETLTAAQIKITRLEEGPSHFDGEPSEMGKTITIEIVPSCLNVIVQADFIN